MSKPFQFTPGDSPLLISIPHVGTEIPDEIQARLSEVGLQMPDTDWHMDLIYDFAKEMGANVLQARYSRYVVDLNRPATDDDLYPGQTKTGLMPVYTFRGDAIYQEGQEAREEEQAERLINYWEPYHHQLRSTLASLREQHGKVLLWDAHSIASVLPRLFEGKLPDLNVGTADGAACDPALTTAIKDALTGCPFTHVINGRFKGGHITRHYGQPTNGVQAIQLEMCQSTYMDETAPFDYRPALANQVKPWVRNMMEAAVAAFDHLPS